MKRFSIKALSVAVPVVTGAVVFAPTVAHADGPTERASVTTTHKNGLGANITCTLRFSIVTQYQNVPTANLAKFEVVGPTECRDATFIQHLTWGTSAGGNAEIFQSYGPTSLLPASSQDIYSPVDTSVVTAAFTESAFSFQFDNCTENSAMNLSLTADGVK